MLNINLSEYNGDELFHCDGTYFPFSVEDFWQNCCTDILDFPLNGFLAKFIISKAFGDAYILNTNVSNEFVMYYRNMRIIIKPYSKLPETEPILKSKGVTLLYNVPQNIENMNAMLDLSAWAFYVIPHNKPLTNLSLQQLMSYTVDYMGLKDKVDELCLNEQI